MSVAFHTNADGRPLSAVIAGVESRLRNMKLPEGYTLSQGGEGEESQEVFGDMFAAMGIALLLMDFVLVLQFESFAPDGPCDHRWSRDLDAAHSAGHSRDS